MYRKEVDTYTLDEIEQQEGLQADCNKVGKVNKHMQYIKNDAVNRLEDLRTEYILENCADREERMFANKVFNFLIERA